MSDSQVQIPSRDSRVSDSLAGYALRMRSIATNSNEKVQHGAKSDGYRTARPNQPEAASSAKTVQTARTEGKWKGES